MFSVRIVKSEKPVEKDTTHVCYYNPDLDSSLPFPDIKKVGYSKSFNIKEGYYKFTFYTVNGKSIISSKILNKKLIQHSISENWETASENFARRFPKVSIKNRDMCDSFSATQKDTKKSKKSGEPKKGKKNAVKSIEPAKEKQKTGKSKGSGKGSKPKKPSSQHDVSPANNYVENAMADIRARMGIAQISNTEQAGSSSKISPIASQQSSSRQRSKSPSITPFQSPQYSRRSISPPIKPTDSTKQNGNSRGISPIPQSSPSERSESPTHKDPEVIIILFKCKLKIHI